MVEPQDATKRWVFKTTQNDDLIAEALVSHMVRAKVKRVGYIGFNDPFGEGFLKLLPGLLAASGLPWKLLDLPALRGLLLSALLDGGKGHDDLAPVSDYVHGRDHRDDAAELRKFQLSTELAVVWAESQAI